MTSIIITALEGVLQSESGRPVEAGCRLYRNLRSALAYQPVVITSAEDTATRRFFDQQHMPAPAHILAGTPAESWEWVSACRTIRRMYPYEIDLVIVPDPALAEGLYYDGFRVMLWIDPRYSRPEWRVDHQQGAASWKALAESIETDEEMYSADARRVRG